MKKKIAGILFCLTSLLTFSQSEIRTTDASEKDIYDWISFMSKGDLFISENLKEKEFPKGEVLRLIITTSEIYNGIYIESGIQSEGGEKMSIKWRRKMNEDDFYTNFSLTGEFTGIEFLKWTSWNSFVLKIQGKKYLFTEVQKTTVKVEKI